MPFNVLIASNYAFLFRNKENKILLGPPRPPPPRPPPPPPPKAQGYERSQYGYTHKCLSIPATCDLDIY